MPEGVVDRLEPIEVDQEQAGRLSERVRQLDGACQKSVEGLAVEQPRERVDLALLASGLQLLSEESDPCPQILHPGMVVPLSLLEHLRDRYHGREHLALQVRGRRTLRQGFEPHHLLADAAVRPVRLREGLIQVLDEHPHDLPQIADHASRVDGRVPAVVAHELANARPVTSGLGGGIRPGRRGRHQDMLGPLFAQLSEGVGLHVRLIERELAHDAQQGRQGIERHVLWAHGRAPLTGGPVRTLGVAER